MTKRTKIIATIGPASSSPAVVGKLIRAGMDAARLNFSHGERSDHRKRIRLIRQEAARAGREIAIIQDLQGPKLRVGKMENDSIMLRRGSELRITTRAVIGTKELISVNYRPLTKDVKAGDRVLLDDGGLELKVLGKDAKGLRCKVVRGGVLRSNKGVILPGTSISLPSITTKDRSDLLFGISQRVDYIALSFVRSAADVEATRRFLRRQGADIPIIAKIEKPDAIRNLEAIINAADGIMVARGDLGVEMSPEEVPLLQKWIIEECNAAEKPVITATQMLESMIANPQPTRAEASDVANAILDGTDCVMLSGETAVGGYPVQAVEVMTRIAEHADGAISPRDSDNRIDNISESMAHAACRTAEEQQAKAIVTFTQSGSTALLVSKHRPSVPVYAATPFDIVARKISLYWGVVPIILRTKNTTDDMIAAVERAMLARKLVKAGDLIVITAGVPVGVPGSTNMIKAHRVGASKSLE